MDEITTECFNASPIKDLTNPELLEMVYNSQQRWVLKKHNDGTIIEDRTAFRGQFNQTCKFLFENRNYFLHIQTLHPNVIIIEDAVRELAMEKVNNGRS